MTAESDLFRYIYILESVLNAYQSVAQLKKYEFFQGKKSKEVI